jgi:hypothetical protein
LALRKIVSVVAICVFLAACSNSAQYQSKFVTSITAFNSQWSLNSENYLSPSALYSVACPLYPTCVAVGALNPDVQTSESPLITISKNGGQSFLQVDAGLKANGYFSTVSCLNSDECIMIGAQSINSAYYPLAVIYNIKMQQFINVNITSNGGGTLDSLDCVNASICVAAGQSGQSGSELPAIYLSTDMGESWQVYVLSGVKNGFLNSISCSSPSSCLAAGASTSGNSQTTVIYESSGSLTNWSQVNLNNDKVATSAINCGDLTCFLSGSTINSTSALGQPEGFPYIGEYRSGEGKLITDIEYKKSLGLVSDIFCFSASSCYAVGGVGNLNSAKVLLFFYQKHQWQVTKMNYSELLAVFGIWCGGFSKCVIVGESSPSSGNSQAISITNRQ